MYNGGKQARHGVTFLLANSMEQYAEKVIPIYDRLISVNLKLVEGISTIQAYAPQQGRPIVEREELY